MYSYGADGIRVKKTAKGVTTEYKYVNGTLLAEKRSDGIVLHYTYDPLGNLSSIRYTKANGTAETYYVRCNVAGDVEQLYNTSGSLIAIYRYDSWGTIVSIKDGNGNEITEESHIAKVNPIRYRGYYYDEESGFYYIGSRYYDSVVGRWISGDTPDAATADFESVGQYNLYAYCFNNPVNMADPTGCWPQWIEGAVRSVAGIITQVKALRSIPSTFVKITATSTIAIVSGQATFGDVWNDMKNYSFFNKDEQKCLDAKVFSSYKGTPVLKHDIPGITSFSISNTIVLNKSEAVNNGGINTVKHEWGHTVQQSIIGAPKYVTRIVTPSVIGCIANPSAKTYYSLPWERTADFFGGANRSTGYYRGSDVLAGIYLFMP